MGGVRSPQLLHYFMTQDIYDSGCYFPPVACILQGCKKNAPSLFYHSSGVNYIRVGITDSTNPCLAFLEILF